MIRLDDIAQFLAFCGSSLWYDQNGVYLPSTRPIARFGLALEPYGVRMGECRTTDAPFYIAPGSSSWGN